MLTIFSTPKPFRGHIGIIQRNALQSWKRLHPDVEIILLGDDAGAAEVCAELGLCHEPHVERNEHGTKFLRSIFDLAQYTARHNLLCYSNCDIILTDDFCRAIERVSSWQESFLMVGRRWDTDITCPVDFSSPAWAEEIRHLAQCANHQRSWDWIDYFVFFRGLYRNLPPFLIGRIGWDNWLLWYARQQGVPLVDATSCVCAVHQNHDYSYHPEGEKGVWEGEEAKRNKALYKSWRCLNTIADASHILEYDRVHRTFRGHRVRTMREFKVPRRQIWLSILGATRPLRRRLGLDHRAVSRWASKLWPVKTN